MIRKKKGRIFRSERMISMNQTISAEFESVDLAELAARNIRYKFEGISKIRIRYPSIEGEDGVLSFPVVAVNNTLGVGFPQTYEDEGYDGPQPQEREQSRASILLVEAEADTAERIASYLRSIGGLGIKISERG